MDYTRPPQLPRLVRLDAARNYLLSGDAAALTASPSRCRYDRKALDDLQDLLSQTGARLRGQVDRGRPQWIGSAEFNHDYVLVCRSYFTPNGQLSVIEAVSRQTYRAEEVKNRAVPVRHPNATEPRYRLVLKNLKVEVVPLLKSATETAPASGDVTYEPSPRRSRRQREKGQG
jgi:hypothetical protein